MIVESGNRRDNTVIVDDLTNLAMALRGGAPLRSGYANGNDFHAAAHGNYHPDSDKGSLGGYAWDKACRWATQLGIDKNDAGNSIAGQQLRRGHRRQRKYLRENIFVR